MSDRSPLVEPISRRRHQLALAKELRYWQRPGMVDSQRFRFSRYQGAVLAAARRCPAGREQTVLDIGCGPACVAQVVPGARAWYLDPLLDAYGAAVPAGERLAVAVEDAELPAAYFDLVLCLNALDHVRDPPATLAAVHRALGPGGWLVLAVYVRSPLMAALRTLQERLHLSTDLAHPFSFSEQTVAAELRRAGFAEGVPAILESGGGRRELVWSCQRPPV